jgi:hypothetical protein
MQMRARGPWLYLHLHLCGQKWSAHGRGKFRAVVLRCLVEMAVPGPVRILHSCSSLFTCHMTDDSSELDKLSGQTTKPSVNSCESSWARGMLRRSTRRRQRRHHPIDSKRVACRWEWDRSRSERSPVKRHERALCSGRRSGPCAFNLTVPRKFEENGGLYPRRLNSEPSPNSQSVVDKPVLLADRIAGERTGRK